MNQINEKYLKRRNQMDDDVKQRFFEIYDAIETDERRDVLLANKEYVYMYLDVLNQMCQHSPGLG